MELYFVDDWGVGRDAVGAGDELVGEVEAGLIMDGFYRVVLLIYA